MRKQKRQRHRGKTLASAAAIALTMAASSTANASPPTEVVKALTLALEDERMAHKTYAAVLDRFGEVRPFANIIHAEARHIDALLPLFERYGVPLPEDVTQIPQEVHTATMSELCSIGVAAEIENVRLYDEELLPAVTDYPDILSVMQALRDASKERHLPAFQRCVDRGGRPGRGPSRN